jgi:hypothetical protein
MKLLTHLIRLLSVLVLLTATLVFTSGNVTHADSNYLESGYAVSTNFDGNIVPVGTTVTVTAVTTNPQLYYSWIGFSWKEPKPNETLVREMAYLPPRAFTAPNVPPNSPSDFIKWAENNPRTNYYVAQDQLTPNIVGDWSVQVVIGTMPGIVGPGGNIIHQDIMVIHVTPIFVVPEAQFGTITLLFSMFGALCILAVKKK